MKSRKFNEIEKIILESGNDLLIEDVKTLLHDLYVHQSELEMQNEELREMQFRLEESRDQYFDLFDNAPVGYFILDTKGTIINVNLTGCTMLGHDRYEVKGKPFSIYLPTDVQSSQIFFTYLKNAFQSEELVSCELFLKNKSGVTFPVQLDGVADFDEGGYKSRIRITLQDRSKEKETEKLQLLNEALKREKDRAQLFLDVAGTMFVLIDSNRIIQMINQKGCEILGCEEDSIIGENWFEGFIPEKDRDQAIADFDNMIYGANLVFDRNHQTLLTKNGTDAIISCHHAQIRDEEGNVIGLLCSGVDITEQKEAENALIESQKRLENFLECLPLGIYIFEANSTPYFANRKILEMFGDGITPEVLKKMDLKQMREIYPTYYSGTNERIPREKPRENLKKVLAGEIVEHENIEIEIKGKRMPLRTVFSPIYGADGKVEYIIGVFEDISERRRVEDELKNNHEYLKAILESAQDAVITANEEGKIQFFNPAAEQLFGYGIEELKDKLLITLMSEKYIERHENAFERYKQTKVAHIIGKGPVELEGKRKDGTEFPIELTLASWNSNVGMYFTAFIRDLSEKKETESAVIESELMFRKLFQTATESIVMANGLGEITAMNKSAQIMFGYGPGELYGQPTEILMPGKHGEIHKGHEKTFLFQKQARQMGVEKDLYAQRKDGTKLPVEVSLSSYKNNDDLLVMIVITDITERKKATQKLESIAIKLEKSVLERTQELIESQELYKKIAHNFPNGLITILDKKLNYTFVEGTELVRMGVIGDTLLGTCFMEQVDAENRDDIEKKMITVLKGKNIAFELRSKKKIYMINAVGMHDSEGNINQILMVSQNITQLKKAEEDIKRALIKEQNLNELKTRFVSMASHEFRTPLTTTMNSISLIDKYIGSKKHETKQRNHIARIKSAVHNLTSILSDFLSMDKLEQGAVEARSSEFNLPAFSKEIIEIITSMATRGQLIRSEHHGEEFIYADKQILKNILNNLLSNATKYSYDNTEITLQTVVKDNILTICVKDYGIGIPEEEQSQLFERFFRGQNALNIQGTGLGLNIVKGYLDLLKGDINFVSELNKGATFIVKIPLEKKVDNDEVAF